MNDQSDTGVIEVLLERLNKQRLPKLLSLKKHVDAGEKLDERDLFFLEEAIKDTHHIQPLTERHPEYRELMAKVARLYHQITEQALKNEQRP